MKLGELGELVELGEVGELVESLWSFWNLESLWSLGHKTSSEALALKINVFSLVFFLASRIRTTSYISSSWVFFILATFETKTMSITHCFSSFFMLQARRLGQ